MITITNGILTASIDPLGAEMKSLKKGDTEFMRHDPRDGWKSVAPVLFPIVGGLKDDTFYHNNKAYKVEKHGFARFRTFEPELLAENTVRFTLKPQAGDEEIYPWDYEFSLVYTLEENRVAVRYEVKNNSDETMYFSVGGHEGYALPEGLEAYTATFEKAETVPVYSVTGPLLDGGKKPFLKDQAAFTLKDDYFTPDALIFKDLISEKVTLDGPSRRITLDFSGFTDLLIWTIPGNRYVCLEPWCGLPDSTESKGNLAEREGIIALGAGQMAVRTHTIEVEAK